jgi:hypothetical protein
VAPPWSLPLGSSFFQNYPQPSYPIYGPPTAPMSHRLTGPCTSLLFFPSFHQADIDHLLLAYEDITQRNTYFPDDRQIPGTPFPSVIPHSSLTMPRRHRRHSVSFANLPPPMDAFRRPSSIHVKFKRKGAFNAGITLGEAQSHVRLSSNDSYSVHDFHADHRGRILLKIRVSTRHLPCPTIRRSFINSGPDTPH